MYIVYLHLQRSPSSRCACSPPPAPTQAPSPAPNSNSGAVIDSVNHLGQGVYSGSFSGKYRSNQHAIS